MAREVDDNYHHSVDTARDIIYNRHYAVDSEAVERLLRNESLTPTKVRYGCIRLSFDAHTIFLECICEQTLSIGLQSFPDVCD